MLLQNSQSEWKASTNIWRQEQVWWVEEEEEQCGRFNWNWPSHACPSPRQQLSGGWALSPLSLRLIVLNHVLKLCSAIISFRKILKAPIPLPAHPHHIDTLTLALDRIDHSLFGISYYCIHFFLFLNINNTACFYISYPSNNYEDRDYFWLIYMFQMVSINAWHNKLMSIQ